MRPEATGNELLHHRCGPQGEWKFQLQRTFAEQGLLNPLEASGFESGGTAASLAGINIVPAPLR